ncbi:auxin-responsive protein SAUR78-like [Humulus lupulus]|uniref:auxin-responsive protein SAUR78-like n=1 Tax=Humulus lupulus TaxID=3486 RepID=UPI002B40FAC2|nr:auxin-responsive protein SAUR78-like [Humulus lupulus]
MAKVGKLGGKLKSAIKRWPSLTKFSRVSSNGSISSPYHPNDDHHQISNDVVHGHQNNHGDQPHAVYVGKSRRRYLVSSEVVEHPLFQELIDKSASGYCECEDGGISVACEVVLFEHLLWMLDNAEAQLGSMDELVEFYTC